jgi:hypothetical protein
VSLFVIEYAADGENFVVVCRGFNVFAFVFRDDAEEVLQQLTEREAKYHLDNTGNTTFQYRIVEYTRQNS